MVVIPPIEGWGTEQVLPLTEGAEYIFVIVSTKGDVADISFSTNSDAGDTISNEFSIVPVDVTPITGGNCIAEHALYYSQTITHDTEFL